jgi:mannan endo-1,4-beta-mannosidase
MARRLFLICSLLFPVSCATKAQFSFVQVKGSQFVLNGKPYFYIETNYWHGAILASSSMYGNLPWLLRELDFMKEHGITNLRIQAGDEGPDNVAYRVTPSLLTAPGKYSDEMFDGLDFLLSEKGKRGLHAILFLNNSWDLSGGFAQHVNWNSYGTIPYPNVKPNTWSQFMRYAGQFLNCDNCKKQFFDHICYMLNRTNRYTGKKYTDNPAVMTWEIGNEPHAFSTENIPALERYIRETATLIRGIDKNHLITTGSESEWGCENSPEVFERIHAQPGINYLTMHIWPKNWSWIDIRNIPGTMQTGIEKTNKYIDDHLIIARRLKKPLVLEEFRLPRDFQGYLPAETTSCRNSYYVNAFEQVIKHCKNKDVNAGCNFCSFGGEGRPANLFWEKGDDYVGDRPYEEQGLNSVFNTDSTIPDIKKYNLQLAKCVNE